MKKPNDIKRPNSNSGSLGQCLRKRERMVFQSCSIIPKGTELGKTKEGVVITAPHAFATKGVSYRKPKEVVAGTLKKQVM